MTTDETPTRAFIVTTQNGDIVRKYAGPGLTLDAVLTRLGEEFDRLVKDGPAETHSFVWAVREVSDPVAALKPIGGGRGGLAVEIAPGHEHGNRPNA